MNSVNADILKKYSQLTKVEKNVCDCAKRYSAG